MRNHLARVLSLALAGTALVAVPTAASAGTASCDDLSGVTPIHAIQGDGWSTPLEEGQRYTIEGVVVGDYQHFSGLSGFFVQEQDADADGDPGTSEGIYVRGWWDAVSVGDRVVVEGELEESSGRTQLTDSDTFVCASDVALPTPGTSDFASDAAREAVEGMRVALGGIYASDVYSPERFGEVGVTAGYAPRVPTDLHEPGSPAALALAEENEARSFILDDGSRFQDPDPMPWVGGPDALRWGDELVGHAIMDYGFGSYRLQPLDDTAFTDSNPRPAGSPALSGSPEVTVASFNVFNYWTTDYDGAYRDCVAAVTGGNPYWSSNERAAQPECGHEPRGHRSSDQKSRQRAMLVDAFDDLGADIVAVQELETPGQGTILNAGDDASETLIDLVGELNAAHGAGTWDYVVVPDGFVDVNTNAIMSGFVYRTGAATPLGEMRSLDSLAPLYDRLPVAAAFDVDGEMLVVVNTHFKSKSCRDATGGDTDQGDGQGCFNPTRTAQAEAVASWVKTLGGEYGTSNVLVVGDMNAYGQEDPIAALRGGGLKDLSTRKLKGHDRYSYVFFGAAGQLDHAFATRQLMKKVTDVAIWHINAAESNELNYFGAAASLERWRSSDHDPVLVGLDLDG